VAWSTRPTSSIPPPSSGFSAIWPTCSAACSPTRRGGWRSCRSSLPRSARSCSPPGAARRSPRPRRRAPSRRCSRPRRTASPIAPRSGTATSRSPTASWRRGRTSSPTTCRRSASVRRWRSGSAATPRPSWRWRCWGSPRRAASTCRSTRTGRSTACPT